MWRGLLTVLIILMQDSDQLMKYLYQNHFKVSKIDRRWNLALAECGQYVVLQSWVKSLIPSLHSHFRNTFLPKNCYLKTNILQNIHPDSQWFKQLHLHRLWYLHLIQFWHNSFNQKIYCNWLSDKASYAYRRIYVP